MKISLLQSQLSINAFMINMIEKEVKSHVILLKYVNLSLKSFDGSSNRRVSNLEIQKQQTSKAIQYAKKKLAKLVELQKSLKSQIGRLVQLHRKSKRLAKEVGKNPWNVSEIKHYLDYVIDEIIMLERY